MNDVGHAAAGRPDRPVSLRDVARHAEVSIGTVSNVLNRPDRVRIALRRRVEDSIQELGFVGSRTAGQLRSKRSSLVGVVLPDVGNPFWATLLRGIETVLDKHGLTLVVSSSRLDFGREKSILREFLGHQVDGLILAPRRVDRALADAMMTRRFGVVTLERSAVTRPWPTLSVDDVQGGQLAAGHLLDRGYGGLVLVNGSDDISWSGDRRAGVHRAIRERGLDQESTLTEIVIRGEGTVAEGLRIGQELEIQPGTGIVCGNDLLALGVLKSLQARGVRVPDDVALVGYDDVDFAAALAPSLTSVRQPSFEMGAMAAMLLVENDGEKAGQTVIFQPELIERDSSAPSARTR